MDRRIGIAVAVAAAAMSAPAHAATPTWAVPGGDARRGAQLVVDLGCGGCHAIPGIRNANGNVGPPLTRIGDRVYIAGLLRNTPPNLVLWIRAPQTVLPGNAMPDMGISEQQALDIAAYLYTVR